MKYHFKVHKEGKGYWAECIELKGCSTQGNSLAELQKNMRESLHLYLDEPESSKVIVPLPKPMARSKNIAEIQVDPHVAFATVLRRERLRRGMTQQKVAKELQVGLYSYQRLESSRTANPRLATIVKLRKLFPTLPLEKVAS